MQDLEQEIQLIDSSDEQNETKEKINQSMNLPIQEDKKDQDSEDFDVGEDDLKEKENSEKDDSSDSQFQIQDESIKDQDQQNKSQSSEEENKCMQQIIDMENQVQDSDNQVEKLQKLPDISGPRIKVTLRDYQKTLFQKSQNRNSIIYLPTGLGKTRIAIASMYYYLSYTQKKKIVFLANTIQLVKQQAQAIKSNLHGIIQNKALCKQLNMKHHGNEIHLGWSWERICKEVACVHGERNDQFSQTKKKKIESSIISRKEFMHKFQNATVIVIISQMFLNCLRRGFIKLSDFSFIVFDQCHHCKGDHPYSGIMNQFYFDLKKKIQKANDGKEALPKIMGLTASPIPQPQKNQKKLQKMIQQLCINLDSNFAQYPKNESQNQTQIQVIRIQQCQQRDQRPYLIDYFTKFTSHRISYQKLQTYFPSYFLCIQQVLNLMSIRHQCLKLDKSTKQIHQSQLFFFYDIKECLFNKLRDIWLELGEYVMLIAYGDLITQLNNIKGLKNQDNQQMLKEVIRILVKHQKRLKIQHQFDKCLPKYFSAKLIKLIQLLTPKKIQNQDQKALNSDSVLIFAFKRRTVQYLDKFFEKYRQKLPQNQRSHFQCTGVTGYSVRAYTRVQNQGISYQTDPSSHLQSYTINNAYQGYLDDHNENLKNTVGASNALQNQLNRFKNAKVGKFLLQSQQKYASQLKKITQFRKRQKRVLISTSVVEQGFDIPECNKVISFDTPFSMKAFIQIKGRARKKNSIYYIFTSEVNYSQTLQNLKIYEDTINATYEIAINRIAKRQIMTQKRKQNVGYKKVATKGGALLNTNYALEILKIYFTTLSQPNKGYFLYNQTPNVCYKCVIKMPQSDPSDLLWVAGQAHSTKSQALKSAAFVAVKKLKIMGFIKDDLRPSKLTQLEDQYQSQKFNDLSMILSDPAYRQIFKKYAQFQQQQQKQSKKRFLRIHFQSIRPQQMYFPHINPKFLKCLFDFQNKQKKFTFQLYHVSFKNQDNHKFMQQSPTTNQIGILTCYDKSLCDRLFSNYTYYFQENPKESFQMKKVNLNLELTLKEYQKLCQAHLFLVAGADNKEVTYYSHLTKNLPLQVGWKQVQNESSYQIDPQINYYPLIVLLKEKKSERNEKNKKKQYQIDYNKIQKIKNHRRLFQNIYRFYNKPRVLKQTLQIFPQNLSDSFQAFSESLQSHQTITLLQSLTPDFAFHKCIIRDKVMHLSQQIMSESKKNHKYNLENRQKKYSRLFKHFSCDNNDVVQRDLWRHFQKEKKGIFFGRTGIKQDVPKQERFYYLKEFVEYPISPQTLFKVTLAKKYVYDALDSYTKSLAFLNVHLNGIFQQKSGKKYAPMFYKHYENVLLANSDAIFEHLADSGKSKQLRNLGRTYKLNAENPNLTEFSLDKSLLNMSNISGIQAVNETINQSNIMDLNLNKVAALDEPKFSTSQTRIYHFSPQMLAQIPIPDIQKVLTSKTYKHSRTQNYEQFEFMGDVVLKYLATLQVFLTNPTAQQGGMHIARANILCNANLHKKAIQHQIFRYIMARKSNEPCPPYKFSYNNDKVVRDVYKGKNDQYEAFGIQKTNKATEYQGYQYIPGKVHADVVQALIGAFYFSSSEETRLDECQQLLYVLDVLKTPSINIDIHHNLHLQHSNIPQCYSKLQKAINYSFKRKGLLIQALTHSTFRTTIQTILDDRNMSKLYQSMQIQHTRMSFMSQAIQDYRTKIKFHQTFYQRLQFLGDSVLDLIVVEHLYKKYDQTLDQGTLSLLKQAGVSNKSLGLIAVKFDLHQLTLMDMPELDNLQKQFTKLKISFDQYIAHPQKLQTLQINEIKLLGDVFQGLVGAILIDTDFNYLETKQIVWKMIGGYIDIFTGKQNINDFPIVSFLSNNNYKNCRVTKISPELGKNGQFKYGLIDRKHSVIQQCWADNQKDAWDIIIQKIQAKQKGSYNSDDDQ